MQNFGNSAQICKNQEIIAGYLISMRNVYLRQELYTISKQIQKKYNESLPALRLVSVAAYEQVFIRKVTYRIYQRD